MPKQHGIGRVLLIDDSEIVRGRLAAVLSEVSDVEVRALSSDHLEVSELIGHNAPDIVVLDIETRGVKWTQLLPLLKKQRPTPTVMVLTNCAYAPVKAKCLRLGADLFFDKSMELDEAVEALKVACSGWGE